MDPLGPHVIHGWRLHGESDVFQVDIGTERDSHDLVEAVVEVDRRLDIRAPVLDIVEFLADPVQGEVDDELRIIGELVGGQRSRQQEPSVIILPELIGVNHVFFGLAPEGGIGDLDDSLAGNRREQAS